MGKKRHAGNIKLSGGILCLDFVNTVHCYGCTDLGEYLNTYDDLLAWSRHVGTINNKDAKILSRKAARHPAEAKSAHKRAIDLRGAVYRIVQESLENVERHADAGRVDIHLSYTEEGLVVTVRDDGRGFDPAQIAPDRIGLLGIHERAELVGAQVELDSRLGEGTSVTVLWEPA